MSYINNLVASYIVVFVMLVCLHTKEKTNKQTLQCSLPKRIFELQTQWIHIYKTVESLIENTIYERCQLEKQEVHRTLATLVSEGVH